SPRQTRAARDRGPRSLGPRLETKPRRAAGRQELALDFQPCFTSWVRRFPRESRLVVILLRWEKTSEVHGGGRGSTLLVLPTPPTRSYREWYNSCPTADQALHRRRPAMKVLVADDSEIMRKIL